MVGIDNGLVWVSYEVGSPGCEGVDDSKKFLVVDIPVSLSGIESSGKESDGVELAFLIPLLKDCYDFSLFLTPTRYRTDSRTPTDRRDSYL